MNHHIGRRSRSPAAGTLLARVAHRFRFTTSTTGRSGRDLRVAR